MKKFFALIAVLALTVVANASFTYSFSELSSLSYTDQDLSLSGYDLKLSSALSSLDGSAAPKYSDDTLMTGQYGYLAGLLDDGTSSNPNNQYTTIGTTVSVVDSMFTLSVYNDNDDIWGYILYATDGTNLVTGNNIVWVAGNGTQNVPSPGAVLTLDLSNFVAPSAEIGVAIIAGSDSDVFHTSFVVPAPGAVLLSGLGTVLVGLVRRRSL